MLKLAYFSPLNPIRSGISDYSEDLLPYLADGAEIDLFVDDFEPTHPEVLDRFSIHPITAYPHQRWNYDAALYHIGNNLYHEAIYRTALQFPGFAVLHDYALGGMLGNITLKRGDVIGFLREWAYGGGREGLEQARAILKGQQTMAPDEPLNRRLIDVSLGLIVHSQYLERRVLETRPLAPVACIPMPYVSHQTQAWTQADARRALGLDPDGLYLGSFGFVVPSKQVEPLLDVLAELLPRFPQTRLVFVGEPLDWYDPLPLIEARGLEDRVTITGYLPFSTWYSYMSAVDLAVNLRYPTLGETSAAVLRLMGEGVPTVVSDVGWYAELPDNCVVKVRVGQDLRAELHRAVKDLLLDVEQRARLSQKARLYIERHHAPEETARHYVAFVKKTLREFTVQDG